MSKKVRTVVLKKVRTKIHKKCIFKFRTEWNVDKLSFWPNYAFTDKSTKISKGRFACFELIRCGAAVHCGGGLAHVQM